jgi:hypothetical protein
MKVKIFFILTAIMLCACACETEDDVDDVQLDTGATPYDNLYGENGGCTGSGCSQIKVITSASSDVLVTVKQDDEVVRHAYIKASDSYLFDVPDGTYQTFFYFGKDWDPEKVMKRTSQGVIKGGFTASEYFGKDEPIALKNEILTYTLVSQSDGNFNAEDSNAEDAL